MIQGVRGLVPDKWDHIDLVKEIVKFDSIV
jgi:hypothetical protein